MRQIEKFQDKCHQELLEYVTRHYPEQEERYPRLLLRLPALRLLSPSIMEELFFAGLIGNVQIDSIIPYILRMETAEYNAQVGVQSQLAASLGHLPGTSMSMSSPGVLTQVIGGHTIQPLHISPQTPIHVHPVTTHVEVQVSTSN